MSKPATTRINVHFNTERFRLLCESKRIAGKETFTTLIDEALEIYLELQKEAVAGFTIIEVRNLETHKRRLLKAKPTFTDKRDAGEATEPVLSET